MTSNNKQEIREYLDRVDGIMATVQFGMEDLIGIRKERRVSGLMNLISFGRAVTFALQNLRSVIGDEFDEWYAPKVELMKADPLMKYFKDARNVLEKQARLNVGGGLRVSSFSEADMKKLGRPPPGATTFFLGDSQGRSGWLVETAPGVTEQYFVETPPGMVEVTMYFSDFHPEDPDLKRLTVDELARIYVRKLRALVDDAKAHFLGIVPPEPTTETRQRGHLRLVK